MKPHSIARIIEEVYETFDVKPGFQGTPQCEAAVLTTGPKYRVNVVG